jgi:hypothetical protein
MRVDAIRPLEDPLELCPRRTGVRPGTFGGASVLGTFAGVKSLPVERELAEPVIYAGAT